jgi:hypothetical protein
LSSTYGSFPAPRRRANRGLIIGIVVALAAVCACALGIVALAAGILFYQTGTLTPVEPTLSPDETVEKMAEIETFVIATRSLEPRQPVELTFLDTEQVRQRTIADFEEDTTPEELADDALVLAAFGLLDARVDLYDLLIRLYSEGVAGFFDPDTQELVVVSDGGFNAYERTVYAHEYTHALQDQVFGIRASGFSDEMFDADPEKASAIQAVLEGDASLLEEQYLDTYSVAERAYYNRAVNETDISIYFDLPPFLLEDFIFPYQQGLEFVRRYYERDGWAGVDALWRDPPVSTEHILHPERFDARDLPQIVARPALTDTLGSGWRQLDSSVNGEWYTYLILAHGNDPDTRLPEADAASAAEGWGGDGYTVFYHDDAEQAVLAAHWVWDTPEDASEFAAAFTTYADARFGPGQPQGAATCWTGPELHCLHQAPGATLWLAAPDLATRDAVLSHYPDF